MPVTRTVLKSEVSPGDESRNRQWLQNDGSPIPPSCSRRYGNGNGSDNGNSPWLAEDAWGFNNTSSPFLYDNCMKNRNENENSHGNRNGKRSHDDSNESFQNLSCSKMTGNVKGSHSGSDVDQEAGIMHGNGIWNNNTLNSSCASESIGSNNVTALPHGNPAVHVGKHENGNGKLSENVNGNGNKIGKWSPDAHCSSFLGQSSDSDGILDNSTASGSWNQNVNQNTSFNSSGNMSLCSSENMNLNTSGNANGSVNMSVNTSGDSCGQWVPQKNNNLFESLTGADSGNGNPGFDQQNNSDTSMELSSCALAAYNTPSPTTSTAAAVYNSSSPVINDPEHRAKRQNLGTSPHARSPSQSPSLAGFTSTPTAAPATPAAAATNIGSGTYELENLAPFSTMPSFLPPATVVVSQQSHVMSGANCGGGGGGGGAYG